MFKSKDKVKGRSVHKSCFHGCTYTLAEWNQIELSEILHCLFTFAHPTHNSNSIFYLFVLKQNQRDLIKRLIIITVIFQY